MFSFSLDRAPVDQKMKLGICAVFTLEMRIAVVAVVAVAVNGRNVR